jgi:hypothetical protein
MKAKLIKQFGKLKPGVYDWEEGLVKKLTDMGFVEEAPKKKKREKAVYEDKAESHEPENK